MNLLTGSCKEWQSKLFIQYGGLPMDMTSVTTSSLDTQKKRYHHRRIGGASLCVPQCSWWCMCLAVLGPVDKCNVKQFVQNRSLIDDEATPRCAPAPAQSPASVTILRTTCALPSSGRGESA